VEGGERMGGGKGGGVEDGGCGQEGDCGKWMEVEERRIVFVSARVHPGETPASWIMHGLIDFLTRPHDLTARRLRQQTVFKVC
jgi:hypothetical protein